MAVGGSKQGFEAFEIQVAAAYDNGDTVRSPQVMVAGQQACE